MCGIVGYNGVEPLPANVIRTLFVLASNRGEDSTGIATPTTLHKKAYNARKFVYKTSFTAVKNFIGHTRRRSSTSGAITDRNAHPFQIGRIRGVHNGYISNHRALANKYDVSIQVDSEIAFHLINKKGLAEALSEMRGSMALVWYDDQSRMNLYRYNKPLKLGLTHDGIYYGSETRYLKCMEVDEVINVDEHTHYIIEDGRITYQEKLENECKPKTTTTSTTHTRPYYPNQGIYTGGNDDWRDEEMDTNDALQPNYAPDYAEEFCKNGKFIFFWSKEQEEGGNLISVEELNGYGHSTIYKFALDQDVKASQRLSTKYPYVYEQLKIDEYLNQR